MWIRCRHRHHRFRPSCVTSPRLQNLLPSPPAGPSPSGYSILGYWSVGRSAGPVEKSIYSAEYQRLCAVLRELRQEAGLTQVQVATRLDVPQSFVSKYETGERRLDVVELRHVAEALGVTVHTVWERMQGVTPTGP